ncbi:hypothetical protein HDV01_007288 [Terramyces sp. JEL0728]|nr:hypothetical protein HDV01_007288 [Terramyces sp. JEL0728]
MSIRKLLSIKAHKTKKANTLSAIKAGNCFYVPVSVKKEEKVVLGLCPFQYKGECKYGKTCKYVHGTQCPNCLKYCLDPRDSDQEHANHILNCTSEQEATECVVCFEIVQEKKDPRFGLLTCQHCVCLECIRTWRENSTSTSKSCPICRSTTYFVTPSTKWPKTKEEKQELIQKYKEKLSQIDCRHYNKGNGTCPFSTSCFYRHVDEYGVKHSDKIRILSNGDYEDEGLKVMNSVNLFDFLVAHERGDPQSVTESHLLKCTQEQYKKPECGICYEIIEEKRDPRYGILSWYSLNCPTCRASTHYIIPSTIWPITKVEKSRVADEYKQRLSVIQAGPGAIEEYFGDSIYESDDEYSLNIFE